MRKITLILGIPIVLMLIFILFRCQGSADQENHDNQNIAKPIITSIAQYHKENHKYPDSMDELTSGSLNNLPETTRGDSFSYRTDEFDGYYLCFFDGKVTNFHQYGCCYTPEYEWECSPGE